MRHALTLVVAAGCTDLGGAAPDAPLRPEGGAGDAGLQDGGMLCDAEVGHVPLDAATEGVSFREKVAPTFARNCDFGGCHSVSNPASGLALAGGLAWSQLVCVRSVGAPMNRVEKGAPERSYLVYKLLGTQLDVGGQGRRMPLGRDPLADIEMGWVTDWIRAGAKDN